MTLQFILCFYKLFYYKLAYEECQFYEKLDRLVFNKSRSKSFKFLFSHYVII